MTAWLCERRTTCRLDTCWRSSRSCYGMASWQTWLKAMYDLCLRSFPVPSVRLLSDRDKDPLSKEPGCQNCSQPDQIPLDPTDCLLMIFNEKGDERERERDERGGKETEQQHRLLESGRWRSLLYLLLGRPPLRGHTEKRETRHREGPGQSAAKGDVLSGY
jgi:hypothetical protein